MTALTVDGPTDPFILVWGRLVCGVAMVARIFSRRIIQSGLVSSVALLASVGSVMAQVTPLNGARNGSEGLAREQVADDILRDSINRDQDGRAMGRFTPGLTAFALGRLRSTDHDGYRASELDRSVSFKAHEESAFGALAYRMNGFQPDSRFSIGLYVGQTWLNTKLGGHPTQYQQTSTGTDKNDATLAGLTATYSVGNFYLSSAFTHFWGRSEVDQTTGGLATLGTSFDTNGSMLNGAIGNL